MTQLAMDRPEEGVSADPLLLPGNPTSASIRFFLYLCSLKPWWQVVWGRVYAIFFRSDYDVAELLTALMSLSWGLWLALPFGTFNTAPDGGIATSYLAMARYASEEAWAVLFGLFGGVQLFALLLDDYRLRRLSAFWGFALWLFVSFMFALSNFRQTTVATYPLIALLCGWGYLRLRWLTQTR